MSSDTWKEELVAGAHFSCRKELEKRVGAKKKKKKGKKNEREHEVEERGGGVCVCVWGEVTATAGVSWDAGQDVDSLFHFPSAFILPTIPCLHSLLL